MYVQLLLYYSVCDRGVSDDSIDVTVKPAVQTKDTFSQAKPITRTQPTWTDLILTCDAGTNTQVYTVVFGYIQ